MIIAVYHLPEEHGTAVRLLHELKFTINFKDGYLLAYRKVGSES